MCGILIWFDSLGIDPNALKKMTDRIAHRGPDGDGNWTTGFSTPDSPADLNRPVLGFGHRRLSILDLSNAGSQPMFSQDRQYCVVYNGEIYNYKELREELKVLGHSFVTETDTEVLIAAYREWGQKCVSRFNGMWAFALFDVKRKELFVSRDRFGVKPLYYYYSEKGFVLCSEIKQLLDLPGFEPKLHQSAVSLYLQNGYEDLDSTYFSSVKHFPAASSALISFDQPFRELRPYRHWEPEKIKPMVRNEDDAIAEIQFLFKDAVSVRLRSDVPVGVCLSGGVDSTSIFAQLNALQGQQSDLRSFSACFPNWVKDERAKISKLLSHVGRSGNFVEPGPDLFLKDHDDLVYHHDAPIYSASVYASYCVSRMAKSLKTPVLLNGQGSDEVFSGYAPSYYLYLAGLAKKAPVQFSRAMLGFASPSGNLSILKDTPKYLSKFLYRRLSRASTIYNPEWNVDRPHFNWAKTAQDLTPAEYRLAEIQNIHLPRLLRWDDRNSMAFGVEARYPFLDVRLVEFVLSLQPSMNMKRGWTKFLLRRGLSDLLPKEIAWQKNKIGFEPPQLSWLRGGLKSQIQSRLSSPSADIFKIIDFKKVQALQDNVIHMPVKQVRDEDQALLFRVSSLDAWLRRFKPAF